MVLYSFELIVIISIFSASKLPIKKVILAFAKSLRNSHVFINIVPIHHAKIPIIKCTHRSTGIDCDLSFNNMSAVYNSRLLNCIIRLDSRIKPVLMKLKGWAKHIGLICTNGFSSYSFYWLGIFCMQVIGILPSVNDLQKSIPQLIVGPWNCAFSVENQELINSKQTSLSEDDILDVIYSYYSNFDYETLVISPYVGCPVLKKNFENKEQLPEELWRYKQFYNENQEHPKSLFLGTSKFSMYLQDPFQHNLNITARVTPKIFEKFIKSCIELKSKPTS